MYQDLNRKEYTKRSGLTGNVIPNKKEIEHGKNGRKIRTRKGGEYILKKGMKKEERQKKIALRLNATAVAQVMENESEKFTFPWLRTMQFHYNYVMRFMKEYDLIFSSKQSNPK